MVGLDGRSLGQVLDRVTWRWVRNDREGLAEFLTRPEAARAMERTYSRVASELAQHDPKGAMEWAGELPEERVKVAAQAVFSSWHGSQPEAAMAWLEDVPESAGAKDALAREAAQEILDKAEEKSDG